VNDDQRYSPDDFFYILSVDLIDPVIVHCCEYNKSDLLPEF